VLNFLASKASFFTSVYLYVVSLFLGHIEKRGTYYAGLDHRLTAVSFDTEMWTSLHSVLDNDNIDFACLYWFHVIEDTNMNFFSNFLINWYYFTVSTTLKLHWRSLSVDLLERKRKKCPPQIKFPVPSSI
jgi:hypothetical protein